MTSLQRFERDLPAILEATYLGPLPPYRDDILGRTAATSQRPGWTFPERWFPMSAISERIATAPRAPWRTVGILALLVLALAAAVLYAGSQQRRLPAPFGPAANGLIVYSSGGDIYTADPVTGATRLLVGGPESDSAPSYSRDGTKVAFFRATATDPKGDIYVVDDAGSNLVKINPQPIRQLLWAQWAPDGRLAVIRESPSDNELDLYDATGRGIVATVPLGFGTESIAFRPPAGNEFMYRALVDGRWGVFLDDLGGGNVRTIVAPTLPDETTNSWHNGGAAFTADGTRVFYQQATEGNPDCCRLWVANVDGTDAHEFIPPAGSSWDSQATVSPDGTRVAFWRADGPGHVSVARTDGSDGTIETGPALGGSANFAWSPDSSTIVARSNDGADPSSYLLDPDGGAPATTPWRSVAGEDWQRLATP
jgi:Tol biopolymer transport system component